MSEGDIYTLIALCTAALFGALAVVFAVKKEKAAALVAGFSSLTERRQARYDRAAIARDCRNWLRLMAEIWLLAAALSSWLRLWAFLGAMALTIVFSAPKIHLDAEKAFKKYLIDKH
ncbi:MAG: DUF3784 domain-containing protein [Clostridia bacterium]|nr:DUF3784 domain-containing protein [Clostridia bacterium]